jgi:hypothetical protein
LPTRLDKGLAISTAPIHSPSEKLLVQFRKHIRKACAPNAQLQPEASPGLARISEPGESFAIKVSCPLGAAYWFSDRRIVLETDDAREVVRYANIRRVYWMFSDLRERYENAMERSGLEGAMAIKRDHYGRIEIEATNGKVVLENLGQAYAPTLAFFRWLER